MKNWVHFSAHFEGQYVISLMFIRASIINFKTLSNEILSEMRYSYSIY